MRRLNTIFRNVRVIPFALLILGAIIFFSFLAIYFFFFNKKSSSPVIAVAYSDITQEVNVTGKIKSAHDVSLAFEKSGKIATTQVDIGTQVKAGQVLITLSNIGQLADLAKAQAGLLTQQSSLDKLKKGSRPEEIAIAQIAVDKAQTILNDATINRGDVKIKADLDLANIYGGIKNTLSDAYAQTSDAINKQIDDFYSADTSSNPQLTFATSDAQARVDVEWQRFIASDILKKMKQEIDTLPSDGLTLEEILVKEEGYINRIRNFLIRLEDTLNSAVNLQASTLAGYRANLATARANVNASITSLTNLRQSIATQKITNQNAIQGAQANFNNAQDDVKAEQAQLKLKQAGPTKEEIETQEAQVKEALAQVESANSELSKTILLSPINGIVTKQDAKLGEIVAANETLVSVIAQNNLEIETNVPEVDIGKIKLSDPVEITLDAFPNEKFSGTVSSIEPGETIVDGVVNFKVSIAFKASDSRFKTGLTANLAIQTLKKTHVLALPQFAIIENDKGTFVKKVTEDRTQEIPIRLGVRGKDGNIEILSGLNEGDSVVNVGVKQ